MPVSLLKEEQQQAIDRLYSTNETLLIAGVGFGKAIVGLTALTELLDAGVLSRVLVLAPLRVCQLTWATEREKWEHIDPGDVAIMCGTPKQRNAAAVSRARIVVTNFENAAWAIDNWGGHFDGLLIDEITKLKTVSGTAAKKLRYWGKRLKWRAGMSANPVAEAGRDIYGQALLLDLGRALGTRKETFTRLYYYPTDFQNRNWAPFPGSEEKIAGRLKALVFYADDAKYKQDLPPVRGTVNELYLPPEGQDLYDSMAGTMTVTVDGKKVVASSAGVLSQKLYQIAAGGLYAGDTEDPDAKAELVWFDPYKLDWALELAAALPGPVVIVYEYTFQLDYLRRQVPGAPVLGQGSKFSEGDLAAWSAGVHKHLFMHPRSAAHGLNLQYGSNNLICLSPVWGADPWQQIVGRLCRRGQPADHVNRWVAVARGTVDEKALWGLDRKEVEERLQMTALRAVK